MEPRGGCDRRAPSGKVRSCPLPDTQSAPPCLLLNSGGKKLHCWQIYIVALCLTVLLDITSARPILASCSPGYANNGCFDNRGFYYSSTCLPMEPLTRCRKLNSEFVPEAIHWMRSSGTRATRATIATHRKASEFAGKSKPGWDMARWSYTAHWRTHIPATHPDLDRIYQLLKQDANG